MRSSKSFTQRCRGQWPFLLVLMIAAIGFGMGLVYPSHWLRAVTVLGVSFLVAAAVRVVLSRQGAGWLTVRSNVIDVTFYTLLGVALIFFGFLVHR